MAETKKAAYKVHNGTDFDTIYFETSADSVKLASGTDLETKIGTMQEHKMTNSNGLAIFIPSTDDLNNYNRCGIYRVDGTAPANCPVTWGLIHVMARGDTSVMQVAYTHNNQTAYYRICSSSTGWTSWRTFTMSDLDGNVLLANNIAVKGKDTSGNYRDLARLNAGNATVIGNPTYETLIYKTSGLSSTDGANDYEIWDDENCPMSQANNGYRKLANGEIEQWGIAAVTTVANTVVSQAITFPIAFPSGCKAVLVNPISNDPSVVQACSGTATTTGVTIYVKRTTAMSMNVYWRAIGY